MRVNEMKKVLALSLILAMLASLCACAPKRKVYKLQADTVWDYFYISCEAVDFEADSRYHNYQKLWTGNFTLKTSITPKREDIQFNDVSIKLKVGFGDDALYGGFRYQWQFTSGNLPANYDRDRYDYRYFPYKGDADDCFIKNYKEFEIRIPDGTGNSGTSYDGVELVQATDNPISYYNATDPTVDNLIIYIVEASGYVITG